jgi:metal-responsive CopG/Arc/MetJ family transcriptional regulator
LLQVSVQVPREVMNSLDEFAAMSGVNRQHLIREALVAYAAMLEGGCRVYQVPGVTANRDRAA